MQVSVDGDMIKSIELFDELLTLTELKVSSLIYYYMTVITIMCDNYCYS